MIIGIGTDLCPITRMDKLWLRFGARLTERICSDEEQTHIINHHSQSKRLAMHFAAKEACVKAIGTGFTKGISWKDVSVNYTKLGQPQLTLSRKALTMANSLLPNGHKAHWHLSLSSDAGLAQAFAIFEARL